MRVTHIKLDAFIVKIARTHEVEAGCDDCAKLSARLLEALMAETVEEEELLEILHHLLMCPPCAQEFQTLSDCVRMDAEDSWPSLDEMWRKIERGK